MQPSSGRKPAFVAIAVGCAVLVSLLALVFVSLTDNGAPGGDSDGQAAQSGEGRSAEIAALRALKAADPLQLDTLEQLAQIAREQGRLADAAAQWGEIVALDPLNESARFEQIRNLYALGDYRSVLKLAVHNAVDKNPDVQAVLAATLLATDQLSAADTLLTRMVAAHPDHPQTRLLYADRLFMKGQVNAAEAEYRALEDVAAVSASAHFGLAQIDLSRGDRALAAARLRDHPLQPTAGYQALKARAELWRQLGELDEAIALYQRMIPKYGAIPEVIVPLAELTASRGEVTQITSLREQLIVGSAPALAAHHYLEALEAYLRQDGSAVLARLGWCETYYGGRDVFRWAQLDASLRVGDVAQTTAAVGALNNMNLTSLRRRHAADLLAARAAELIDRNDATNAELLVEQARRLVPEHRATHMVAARLALVKGREQEAAQLAAALARYDDVRPAALEILGRANMALGELEVAEGYLREMVSLLPEASTGHYWLGVNLFRQRQYVAAAQSLQAAYGRNSEPRVAAALLDALLVMEQWPQADELASGLIDSSDAAGRAIGWAFKAGIYRAKGDLELAIEAYRQALREQPSRAAYALAVADMLIDIQQYTEAQAVLDELAVSDPGNRIVRFKQGYAAQLAGNAELAVLRYRALLEKDPSWALVLVNLSELLSADEATRAEALTMAQRAATLSPEWDRAHWNLAQRAMAAGDRAQARIAIQRVLTLAPQDAEAQAMAARLGW